MGLWYVISSISLWLFERGSELGPIKEAGDAFYATWITMATIGFGDMTPATVGGRVFISFDALVGLVLFGIVIALINYSWQPSKSS